MRCYLYASAGNDDAAGDLVVPRLLLAVPQHPEVAEVERDRADVLHDLPQEPAAVADRAARAEVIDADTERLLAGRLPRRAALEVRVVAEVEDDDDQRRASRRYRRARTRGSLAGPQESGRRQQSGKPHPESRAWTRGAAAGGPGGACGADSYGDAETCSLLSWRRATNARFRHFLSSSPAPSRPRGARGRFVVQPGRAPATCGRSGRPVRRQSRRAPGCRSARRSRNARTAVTPVADAGDVPARVALRRDVAPRARRRRRPRVADDERAGRQVAEALVVARGEHARPSPARTRARAPSMQPHEVADQARAQPDGRAAVRHHAQARGPLAGRAPAAEDLEQHVVADVEHEQPTPAPRSRRRARRRRGGRERRRRSAPRAPISESISSAMKRDADTRQRQRELHAFRRGDHAAILILHGA